MISRVHKLRIEKEFKVNDLITLKLENRKTTIYVGGERFMQCKYLLLVNPHERAEQFEINSIDEAADNLSLKLEKELKPNDLRITPAEEFWGHCSNIQAWVESNYDTRLLHRNLAFNLLEELAKKGEKIAEFMLKEEIAKRLGSGNKTVVSFLIEQSLISYLSDEEIIQSILASKEAEIILTLESKLGRDLLWAVWKNNDTQFYYVEDKHVKEINLIGFKLERIPELLGQLEYLEKINISNNDISTIPISIIKNLKNLREINLTNNLIPDSEIKKIKKKFPKLNLI